MSLFSNYIEVLKPRASILLTFIGICSAVLATGGNISSRLLLIFLTILIASAGANGLTNYLDRDIDAKMKRTQDRTLPSRRIYPPERVLPLTVGLVVAGLILASYLGWLCLLADLAGTVSAVVWRKRWTCVFPQGVIASCAPVLMGWFAFKPIFSWELLCLCLLVIFWVPLHVWSVMVANREDYIAAGLTYFPASSQNRYAVGVLLIFALLLCTTSVVLYFVGHFTWIYLLIISLLDVIMVYSASRLVVSGASRDAWRLYKLSAFPYLGLVFLTIALDTTVFTVLL